MGDRTSEATFYPLILRALVDMGGRGSVTHVLKRIEPLVRFKPADRELVAKGEERWRNTARFARKDLVDLGYLKRDSPRGTWEVAEPGRSWLQLRSDAGR